MNKSKILFTLSFLERMILDNPHYGYNEVTVELVGMFLCGNNSTLAERPLSVDFLCNVAYNSETSYHAVLWLQLNALENTPRTMKICMKD